MTTGDLNISKSYNGLMKDIIIDGRVLLDNLNSTNYNEQWVREQLKIQSIFNIQDVFYAGLNDAGVLYVSVKTID